MNPCDQLDALAHGLMDIPDLVFAFTPDGTYLFVNTVAAQYLGCEAEELRGYHWSELGFSAEIMEPFTSAIAQTAAEDTPRWYQLHGSAERGNRVFDISLTPLHKPDGGGVVAVLVISRDVTQYVRGG